MRDSFQKIRFSPPVFVFLKHLNDVLISCLKTIQEIPLPLLSSVKVLETLSNELLKGESVVLS